MENQFDFPPVLDENNQPLSAEEAEQSLRFEPTFIAFCYEKNGVKRTHYLACNLNNIDESAMTAHDDLKNEIFAVRLTRPAKMRSMDNDDNDTITGEQLIKAGKIAGAKQHRVFMDILFPKDWETNPMILGSTSPEVPSDPADIKAWFARGGYYATIAMEAVIMHVDPTGPLAQGKQQVAKIEALTQEADEIAKVKMAELQNLDFRQLLLETAASPEPAPTTDFLTENEAPSSETKSKRSTRKANSSNSKSENSDSQSDDVGATESSDAHSNEPTEAP